MAKKETEAERAKRLGYSQGYSAGRRAKTAVSLSEQQRLREKSLWQKCFLAVLPEVVNGEAYVDSKGVRLSNVSQRVAVARDFADYALKEAVKAGKV